MTPTPPLQHVGSRYGAPMGRGTVAGDTRTSPEVARVSLRRIRLNSGGYDTRGAYWGHHQRLYWAGSDCGLVDTWFRAPNRVAAKAHVLARFPAAKFYGGGA